MPRILHLGLGAFHRAHQAAYLQTLHDAGERRWTLAAGNIRAGNEETVEALQSQAGAFTLETVAADGQRRYRRIQAIDEVLPWQPDLQALVDEGSRSETAIVSFTVTEAGYFLDAGGRLGLAAPDVSADVNAVRSGGCCTTVYGALALILRERMRRGSGAVTLLSCDNLRHNGDRSRAGLMRFLEAVGDAPLQGWIDQHTTWPNSMVDRITPRPTADVLARVLGATGFDDRAAVMSEDYSQWVIEDAFAAGRPPWEQAGVELVASVAPYEEAKIRLLNASHSAIAWAGTLAGTAYIHEGVADAEVRGFAERYLVVDAIPTLQPSPVDLAGYGRSVLERFGNALIRDSNERVAADSFAKLMGFVAPTVRDRLARGLTIDAVAMLPALYLAWLQRWHAGLLPYAYEDQSLAADAAARLAAADDPVGVLAADARVWQQWAGHAVLVASLRRARATVAEFDASRSTTGPV